MTKLTCAAAAVALACSAGRAGASTPDAWAELFAKANAACTKAAGLASATTRGYPIDFDDVVLVIVDGRYPQPHMKNAKSTKYCLYRKQTAKADAFEASAPVAEAKTTTMGRTCWSASFRTQLKSPRAVGLPCTAKNDEGDTYTGVVRR
jgi:hypothetical protein